MLIYNEIVEQGRGEFEDRGSRFIATALNVKNSLEVEEALEEEWKAHPKARHICFAYRLGFHQIEEKAEDDGEPGNTAGMPILNHLKGRNLTHSMVMVVRYFGGTLLGKGGLIKAYGTAASLALDNAKVEEKKEQITLKIESSYADVDLVKRWLKDSEHEIIEQKFEIICTLSVNIDKDRVEEAFRFFDSLPNVKTETL